MAAIPLFVVHAFLNGVKPFFCAGVNLCLVDALQEDLYGFILERTCVAEDDVYLSSDTVELLLDSLLDLVGRLLILKPFKASG